MSEKGVILPTVIVCMFLTTSLVIGASHSIQSQASQKEMLEDSYRVKSMLNLTEEFLLSKDQEGQDYEFVFNHGKVTVKYNSPTHYELIGTLDNGFQSQKIVAYTKEKKSKNQVDLVDDEAMAEDFELESLETEDPEVEENGK